MELIVRARIMHRNINAENKLSNFITCRKFYKVEIEQHEKSILAVFYYFYIKMCFDIAVSLSNVI